MTGVDDWNRRIIEEFRAHDGRVGGSFEGLDLLLLHSTGARSGRERINPVAYLPVGDGYAVFATKGGSPTNPDWFHNVRAHPDVTIEVGTQSRAARARVADGEERDRLYGEMSARHTAFADYERKTDRVIPVVVLEPLD